MKKVILVLIGLCLMVGCSPVFVGDIEVEEMSYKGNELVLNLDFSDGTGFEWMKVASSDNLEMIELDHHVEREDETSTGGSGTSHLVYHVKDGDEAWLILKYARPFEGDGSFKSYVLTLQDGEIVEVKEESNGLYQDYTFQREFFEEGMFRCFALKDWVVEPFQEEDQFGFYVSPSNENDKLKVFYGSEVSYEGVKESSLMITDVTYRVYQKEGEDSFLAMYGENHIGLEGSASWIKENYLDIIKLLDTTRLEE